jgi:hypothetical protein
MVHITGLERSGTTFFHNVLARHGAARALLRFELMEPVPLPEAADDLPDPRIAKVQASVEKLRGTTLERMHWVNADEPEECAWGFIDAISMLGQSANFWMPQWRRFLTEEDPTPAYEHYRRVVQLLLWQRPAPPGGFLVLKSPQISRHIDAFAAVFPEAHFVIADRDPFRCVVSTTFMGYGIVDPFCTENPLTDDGGGAAVVLSWARGKLAVVADFTAAHPDRITHVAYPDLVSDPVGTAQCVFAATGRPVDGAFGEAVALFLDSQRSGGRATPPPDLPAMGYDADTVLADPVVNGYCRRFGVQRERARLVGVHSPA